MHSLRCFLALTILIPLNTAPARCEGSSPNSISNHKADREDDVKSPKGTFIIEQRRGRGTWIRPTRKHSSAYQLRLWHDSEIDWAGYFRVSPNERYLLDIQKTGSGENYGAIFVRDKTHKFVLAHPVEPFPPLSENAWDYFRKSTGREAKVYHDGIEFVSWGTDGKCLEFSMHGSDLGEEYYVRDWRLHYNLLTHRFFQTHDQLIHNRHAIIIKHDG